MTDADYIQPENRWFNSSSVEVNIVANPILDSHLVADSVMQELAEALRRADIALQYHGKHVLTSPRPQIAAAIARFDALGGSNE